MPVADVAGSPVGMLQLVADPERWRLMALLGESDRRVGDLVALTGRAQNAVSYHLRKLAAAGVVAGRQSSADGRDTYYRLNVDRLGDLLAAAGSALHPGLRLVATAPASPVLGRRKPRVLFLCTGNSARSQIAEALLEHRSGGRVRAASAGSHPKVLHPNAVRVLADRGIDIAGRRTKHLDTFRTARFDRVITLCDKVKEVCPELPGAPVTAHWSMADPAASGDSDEATYPTFEVLTEEIDGRVRLLLAQLAHPKEANHAQR